MCKPFEAKFIGKNEKCLFLLKSPILTTYRAQATRHKRAACLCMYRGLATPNRTRTVARFFYSINFPCGCGGSQIFRVMKKIVIGVILLIMIGGGYWGYSRFVSPQVDYVKTALSVIDLYGTYQEDKSIDYGREVQKLLGSQYHMEYVTDDSIAAYRSRLSDIDRASFDFELANPGMYKNPMIFNHVFKSSLNNGLKLDIITHDWGIGFIIYCETPEQKVIAQKLREELRREAAKIGYFDSRGECLNANFTKKIRESEDLNTIYLGIQ